MGKWRKKRGQEPKERSVSPLLVQNSYRERECVSRPWISCAGQLSTPVRYAWENQLTKRRDWFWLSVSEGSIHGGLGCCCFRALWWGPKYDRAKLFSWWLGGEQGSRRKPQLQYSPQDSLTSSHGVPLIKYSTSFQEPQRHVTRFLNHISLGGPLRIQTITLIKL